MAVGGHSIAYDYLVIARPQGPCLRSQVRENSKQLLMGGKELKMYTYKPGAAMEILSLGRKEAVAQRSFGTMIGKFPGMIKSIDLLLGKARKYRGV
ncbi:hypothetical protein POTOM_001719 [Populus tomentosa]|uniref:Uncharacterized protein n=1 Tax=Populus tomentosa TaxID=118781 RepID=A0A8X8IW05_POPTO|nr:hypothetical protein POTOM_001719 [Populus tomentosa]